jgi:hypothetical protein
MTTPSEELISRYSRVEREADAFGRVIGCRKLKVSQQSRVIGMTQDLEGETEVVMSDEDGREKKVRISHRSQMLIAAAVCEVDSVPIPFAKTRFELDAIADRLDEEGLMAAMKAYARFQPKVAEGEEVLNATDEAKKSHPTHTHGPRST